MQRVVVGVGSPHGSDHVGWSVVDRLKARGRDGAKFFKVANPIDVLDYLGDCEELILVDAVHGLAANTLQCWTWPNQQITDGMWWGSHGIGLVQMLELAGELRLLPKSVRVVGIAVELDSVDANFELNQEFSIDKIVEEVEAFYA